MKKVIASIKESSILSLFKKNKETTILNVISCVLYVLGAFAFFEFMYILCNLIGSIVSGSPYQAASEIKYMLPEIILLLSTVYLGIVTHVLSRPRSYKSRDTQLFVNGIVTIVLGTSALLYLIVGLISGLYPKIVIGMPTLLFPLDMVIFSIALIGVGVFMLIYEIKISPKHPCTLELRNDDRKKVTRIFDRIFFTLAYLLSIFGFAAFIQGIFIIDWIHGHVFFSLMLMLVYLIAALMPILFKFVYLPIKEESKNYFLRKVGLFVLIVDVVVFVLYIVSSLTDPMASTDACYGIMPVEFTASVNAHELLYGILFIAAPLTAMIKGKIHNKK